MRGHRARLWVRGVVGVALIFAIGLVGIYVSAAITGRGFAALVIGTILMGLLGKLYVMRLGFLRGRGLIR